MRFNLSMQHRERIFKTLNGEPIDRIARGEFFIADEFVRAFLSLDNDTPILYEHRAQIIEQLDLDIAPVALSWGWGSPQQPNEDDALESIVRWRGESERFVFAVIDGPFSTAVKAAGFDALMRYIHDIPHVAKEYYQRGVDEARIVAQAVRDAGADGVVLGEDLAYNRSTFFSPAQLRECYFPALAQAAQALRELGLAVFFHSDGNLNAILSDLAACKLDGIQGLEPPAQMSLRRTREKIGDTLTLWGNLSFEFLSVARTDAEIDAAIDEIVRDTGKVILGSCGGLVAGMNIETVTRVYRRK
jgi:uroporphyrinogen decarboxylase